MDSVTKITRLIVKYKNDTELVPVLFKDSLLSAVLDVDKTKTNGYSHNTSTSSCFKILIQLNLHECLKILLDYKLIEAKSACIVVPRPNSYKKTPLHFAIETPNALDCFNLLCNSKYSDLNCPFNDGKKNITAIYLAFKQNSTEKMKLLLSKGADINASPSILLEATRAGMYNMTRFLIENGVKTDITENDETPLLLAAKGNFKEIMDLLLHGIQEETPAKKKSKKAVDTECVVCLEAPKEVAFIPCGHMCCCQKCGLNASLNQCPVCRLNITKKQKIFL